MMGIRVEGWRIRVGKQGIRVGMRGIGSGNEGNQDENLPRRVEMMNKKCGEG